MRSRFLVLAALCAALVGCRSKDAPAPAASASAVVEAPAPEALLAELSVGNPKETWQRVRRLGGDLAAALPSSLPVLLTTSLSMPPSAAGNLDESLPMVGALLSRKDAPEPDAVLGMHVVSGAELVASLTLGDSAKFRRVELAPRLVRLLPAPGAPDFNGALGVSGNYLLLATRPEALIEAGRFVAEGVSKRARSEPGLSLRTSEKVLAGSLSRTLRDAWVARRASLAARDRAEREARGRPPDFADPEVLLGGIDNTVESWLGVLESSRELTLALTPEADRLRAELTLLPGAAEGAAALLYGELVVGSLSPLLALPESTSAALLLRGDDKPPGDTAQGLGASVTKLFGERLRPEQARKLSAALTALSRSRRGATVVGLVTAPAPALVVTCELADAEAFPDAVADVLRLLELAPVSSWLGSTVGTPQLELFKAASAERRARVRFQRAGRAALPLPSELYLTWAARDGVGYLVVAPDAKLGLVPFASAARLSSSAWMTQSQARVGERALGVFADARLMRPGGPEPLPVLLTFGKQAERIAVSVDAAPAALHALAGLFALDRSP